MGLLKKAKEKAEEAAKKTGQAAEKVKAKFPKSMVDW
jgi:hypothetical protein